jgi:membrane protease subunit HflK
MRYLLAVLGLLVVLYLLTGVTQVRPGERAVVRRFGRVLAEKPGPGLHVGLPWGIDRIDRVPVDLVRRVQVGYQRGAEESGLTTPAGQYLTGDRNLVNIQVTIHYAVREEEIEDYVVQQDRADGLVARAAESVLAEWVAGRTVDDILLSGKTALRRRLVYETQERLQPYGLGVRIQEASIADLAPPEQVKEAFDDVTRAQTEIRTRINEAEQDADRKRQDARAEAEHLRNLAEVFVKNQIRQAEVDRDSFNYHLEQIRKPGADRGEYLRLVWWQTVGKMLLAMAGNGQIDEISNYLSKNGLEIVLPLSMRPRPK